MRTRSFRFPGLLLFAATAVAASLSTTCAHEAPAPDVLLIAVDTLRWDALGASGNARASTPTLDALFARGTAFDQAIAPMPRTTPAVGSLLTGLEPHRHGSREVGDPVTDGTLLAERLRAHGYATVAVSANDSAGRRQQLDRGFDHFVDGQELKQRYTGRLYRDREPVPATGVGWAEATTDEALRLASASPEDQPMFLWAFYFDPHFFYRPPAPWQDGIEAETCWQLYEDYTAGRLTCGEVIDDRGGTATATLDACRSLYRAEVTYTDAEIGRLLDGIAALDRGRETIVVFTADHGENLGEGGLYFEHGENVHDAALRVPLLFTGPGITQGRVDRGSAGLIDVVPTLLALLGLEARSAPPSFDGTSLVPRLGPGGTPHTDTDRRPLFAESATSFCSDSSRILGTGRMQGRPCLHHDRYSLCRDGVDGPFALYDHVDDPRMTADLAASLPQVAQQMIEGFDRWPPETARQRTLRLPRYKLVQTPRFEGGYRTALFDLLADPGEARDLSAERPELTARMAAELERWADAAGTIEARTFDPELEESLRALGYIN